MSLSHSTDVQPFAIPACSPPRPIILSSVFNLTRHRSPSSLDFFFFPFIRGGTQLPAPVEKSVKHHLPKQLVSSYCKCQKRRSNDHVVSNDSKNNELPPTSSPRRPTQNSKPLSRSSSTLPSPSQLPLYETSVNNKVYLMPLQYREPIPHPTLLSGAWNF